MAITRDDILYLLDQRVKPGPIPIIGADPVFSRDSARVYRSRDGHLRTAYVDTPVMEYRKDATGQYRNVLPLTLGRTNRVGYSRDYSQWTPNAVTPTGGQSDPTGETGATLLNATAASGNVNRNTTALSGDGTKSVGVILKAGTAAQSWIGLYDATAGTFRRRVAVTWGAGGVPTIAQNLGSGTQFPPVELWDGWWWLPFTGNNCLAANTHGVYVYPAGGSTGTVYAFDAQVEDGAFPTWPIHTAGDSAVSRAVETLAWPNPPAPQGMVIYHREIVALPSSAWDANNYRVWDLSTSSGNPRLLCYRGGADILYAYFHNGTTDRAAVAAVSAAVGDLLETLTVLSPGGVLTVAGRVNEGTTATNTVAALSPLPTEWQGGVTANFNLNSVTTSAVGAGLYERLAVAKYAALDADLDGGAYSAAMDEMAALHTTIDGTVI